MGEITRHDIDDMGIAFPCEWGDWVDAESAIRRIRGLEVENAELVYALREAHWLLGLGSPDNPEGLVTIDGKLPRETLAILSINAALAAINEAKGSKE